jgi:SAM-dependent methyltransferase
MNLVYMGEKQKEYRIPYSSCPLCSSSFTKIKSYQVIGNNYSVIDLPEGMKNLQWVVCDSCGHIFTDGYFTPEALNLLFSYSKMPNKTTDINGIEGRRPFWMPTLDRVMNYVKDGRWLDVGAGEGSLLIVAAEYGFTPVALDLDQERADFLKSLGIEAYLSDIENFKQKDFDIITLMDVLEHVPFPDKVLSIVHSKLKKNGILVVSTPNAESLIWKPMSDAGINPYWYNLEHYHSFSKKNLYSLLRETGFEPVSYSISNRYKICMEVIALRI